MTKRLIGRAPDAQATEKSGRIGAGKEFEKVKPTTDLLPAQKIAALKRYVEGLNPEIKGMKTYVLRLLSMKRTEKIIAPFNVDTITGLADALASCFPKHVDNIDEAKLYVIGLAAFGTTIPRGCADQYISVFIYASYRHGQKKAKKYFSDVLHSVDTIAKTMKPKKGEQIAILDLQHPFEVEMRSDPHRAANYM